jgi:predicted P-loop ATPase/GTPase
MKKFSQHNVKHNPYGSNTLKGQLYKLVENKLTSKNGNIVGIEELVEKIDQMLSEDTRNMYVELLTELKNGMFESEEVDKEDDFSSQINQIVDNPDVDNSEQDNFTTQSQNNDSELTNEQIDYFNQILGTKAKNKE